MNLKFETIIQIFRKIIQLIVVIILKSTNEYYRKIISKIGRKMDLYPAMNNTFTNLNRSYSDNAFTLDNLDCNKSSVTSWIVVLLNSNRILNSLLKNIYSK